MNINKSMEVNGLGICNSWHILLLSANHENHVKPPDSHVAI